MLPGKSDSKTEGRTSKRKFRRGFKEVLRREEVIEYWDILIENGNGESERVFSDIERNLIKSEAPIKFERKKIAPGIIKGLIGESRDFILVRAKGFRLKPYQIFINVRDYGRNLQVSWFLTYRYPLLRALMYLIFPFLAPASKFIERLDLFNLQDLRAFASVCHISTINAVENLMIDLDQDTSKINRKTKGFLGIG